VSQILISSSLAARSYPFAILGDVLRPKSFAGLFGAAPSVHWLPWRSHCVGRAVFCRHRRSLDDAWSSSLLLCVSVSRIMMRYNSGHLSRCSWFLSGSASRGYLLLRLGSDSDANQSIFQLRANEVYDYGFDFFWGLITALAELSRRSWPRIGGLFLAFPAILPASATLIEKHERDKKDSLGLKAWQ